MAARTGTAGLVGLGAFIALGLVASAALVSNAAMQVKRQNQALEVKGYAERAIDSDLAIWTGSFTTRAPALESAYEALEEDRAKVIAFLTREGLPSYDLQPVSMSTTYRRNDKGRSTNEIEGYVLTQAVKITSNDIERIARISREAASLVKTGVEFSTHHPQYLYTRLGELKIAMLGEATADARERAETLARESGGALGPLLSARQGVFQITPAHSTEISDYGRNDTSAREKSIKAVVTVRFAVGQ